MGDHRLVAEVDGGLAVVLAADRDQAPVRQVTQGEVEQPGVLAGHPQRVHRLLAPGVLTALS